MQRNALLDDGIGFFEASCHLSTAPGHFLELTLANCSRRRQPPSAGLVMKSEPLPSLRSLDRNGGVRAHRDQSRRAVFGELIGERRLYRLPHLYEASGVHMDKPRKMMVALNELTPEVTDPLLEKTRALRIIGLLKSSMTYNEAREYLDFPGER